MNRINVLAVSAAMFLVSLSPLAAKDPAKFQIPKGTRVLLCDFKVGGLDKLTPSVTLVMTDKAGKITAYDGLIAASNLSTLPVTILTENDKRITYGWTVPGFADDRNQYVPATKVRLTVQNGDLSAMITMMPLGYRNENARGTCRTGVIDK